MKMKKVMVLRGEECSSNVYVLPFRTIEEALQNIADEWWIYESKQMEDLDGSNGIYLIFDRKSMAGNENWRLVEAPKFKEITTTEHQYITENNEYNFFGKGSWDPIGTSYEARNHTMSHYELEVIEVKEC